MLLFAINDTDMKTAAQNISVLCSPSNNVPQHHPPTPTSSITSFCMHDLHSMQKMVYTLLKIINLAIEAVIVNKSEVKLF